MSGSVWKTHLGSSCSSVGQSGHSLFRYWFASFWSAWEIKGETENRDDLSPLTPTHTSPRLIFARDTPEGRTRSSFSASVLFSLPRCVDVTRSTLTSDERWKFFDGTWTTMGQLACWFVWFIESTFTSRPIKGSCSSASDEVNFWRTKIAEQSKHKKRWSELWRGVFGVKMI